jgi:hypothetical protein
MDLQAALKLLEGLEASQLETTRGEIAERIAGTDLDAARGILGMINEQSRPAVGRAAAVKMAAKNMPAARALVAEDRDPVFEALLPAIAAQGQASIDPRAARLLLRDAVGRLVKLENGQGVRPSPSIVLARLLPLAVRVDPDRAADVLWLAVSRRPPLQRLPRTLPVALNQVRPQYLDLAELSALVSRYDRVAAEAIMAPVIDRLEGLTDENWGLGSEGSGIFRAAGAFDARVARKMLDDMPDDPAPPPEAGEGRRVFRRQSKALARIALAEVLGLPPDLRLRDGLIPGSGSWLASLER